MTILLFRLFGFLDFGFIDFLDILLVAVFMYFLYKLLRGTIAFNIFIGLLSVYLVWWIVQALNMSLLSRILGQFIGVGVLALLIVFQQEVRKFLLLIGQRNIFLTNQFTFKNILPWNWKFESEQQVDYAELLNACQEMAKNKTGALIVVVRAVGLRGYAGTGTELDALVSARLLMSIFFKNNPLHDGAIIIEKDRIIAAACILPVSGNMNIPDHYGLRHRAALGISEVSDAIVISISEETGEITVAKNGTLFPTKSLKELKLILEDSNSTFLHKVIHKQDQ